MLSVAVSRSCMVVGDKSDAVKRYEEQFFTSLPLEKEKSSRFVEPVAFGFTREDATEIAKLVVDGIKIATGSLLWSYEADGKPLPGIGDLWVVIDGDSKPVCIAQTTNVAIIPFNEVPEEYARWGGEGDCSLESWRRIYWNYIVVECKRIGRVPTANAPLVMERFAVTYSQPHS
jgi:uncharacterized protein YhfF